MPKAVGCRSDLNMGVRPRADSPGGLWQLNMAALFLQSGRQPETPQGSGAIGTVASRLPGRSPVHRRRSVRVAVLVTAIALMSLGDLYMTLTFLRCGWRCW